MRNIIITGGELFNKGAQAMVFITVHELKKRFPNHQIFLLSDLDLKRPVSERDQYAFNLLGWFPIKFARAQSNIALKILCSIRNRKEYSKCKEIYGNCDLMVDISGYALGSNWSYENCNYYLEHIEFAQAFQIPFFIMPQSMGPFDFKGEHADELLRRCEKLLPYPRVINVREQDGFEELTKSFRLNNVRVANDLVLNNKELDYRNVFKSAVQLNIPCIQHGSIGIIPNSRNLDIMDEATMLTLYYRIIDELLKRGRKVYLLTHATQDLVFCKKIKEQFPMEDNLFYLNQDFTCIEFNEIVKQFRFIIASRFHAIVHAYKNAVPCVSIGWAVKYHDLLTQFGQEQYIFDVRQRFSDDDIMNKILYLDKNADEESDKIQNNLLKIQEKNVFDILSLKQ